VLSRLPVLLLAGLLTLTAALGPAQPVATLLPVGVEYAPGATTADPRRDLEEMRRLRFTVVRFADRPGTPGQGGLILIDRLLAGAPDPTIRLPPDRPAAVVAVARGTSGGDVHVAAWSAVAGGAGAILFSGWTALLANDDALAIASQFAEAVERNATLYAPLRPVDPAAGTRRVRLTGDTEAVDVTLLESPDALVIIGVNRARDRARVTMTFSPDVPEAIWQNMLAGGAVSFVATAGGPEYERVFPPQDVLVLSIRKARR
jgi:hypothetical protein